MLAIIRRREQQVVTWDTEIIAVTADLHFRNTWFEIKGRMCCHVLPFLENHVTLFIFETTQETAPLTFIS